MSDFARTPYGSSDEDGESGYVDITASTATQETARSWLLNDGAEDVLGVDESRRAFPDNLQLRRLTVCLPPYDTLPERVNVADHLRSGVATGWWQFDISAATEEIEDADWRAEAGRRAGAHKAEQHRLAVEECGPWWWRLRCRAADWLRGIAERARPDDIGEVFWLEDGEIVTARVRRPVVDRTEPF